MTMKLKDYGAVGDGVTDDTEAVQRAYAVPSVDIEPGNLFMWQGERRAAISIKTEPPDLPVVIHDGWFISAKRPRHWWHLLTWIRVARALWHMPFEPGPGGSVLRLRVLPTTDDITPDEAAGERLMVGGEIQPLGTVGRRARAMDVERLAVALHRTWQIRGWPTSAEGGVRYFAAAVADEYADAAGVVGRE